MSLATGLSGLKAAADLTRSLRDGLKSGQIKADEISGRIGEIYDYIIDSKDAVVDAKDEIQRLKSELDGINDDKAFRLSVQFSDQGFYFRRMPGLPEERYCSVCLDDLGKRIRLLNGEICHRHGYRGA